MTSAVALLVGCSAPPVDRPAPSWSELRPRVQLEYSGRLRSLGVTATCPKYDTLGGAHPGPAVTTEWVTLSLSAPRPFILTVIAEARDDENEVAGEARALAAVRLPRRSRFQGQVKLVFNPPIKPTATRIRLDTENVQELEAAQQPLEADGARRW